MSMELLQAMNGVPCPCGREHGFSAKIYAGAGVLRNIPHYLAPFGVKKVFLLCDSNTYAAAGQQVEGVLTQAGIPVNAFVLTHDPVEPDEYSMGAVALHFDPSCDGVVAVGSGVINDLGKIISHTANKPYMIVATAPSMDGYASATSSMTRSGLKVSLPSKSADIIVGDTEILCGAPLHMMKSGLGDMLAKYVSICEWRIAHLLVDEYYCQNVAELIRSAVKKCVDNAPGLLHRDAQAVQAVFEGLVIGGIAMNYAGLSRPASGGEHYLSHLLDMRAVAFGTPAELHGIQCAVGTLEHLKLYEKLKKITPDREKALQAVKEFSFDAWSEALRRLLGKGAQVMIAQEKTEKKYDREKHAARLERILERWPELLEIIERELPPAKDIEALLTALEMPKTMEELGVPREAFPVYFAATRDIRDKYVLSRLAWDLGITEEIL